MSNLIDRDEAIRILDKIRQEHAARQCQRSSLIQAQAFEYAITVIKRLPGKKA